MAKGLQKRESLIDKGPAAEAATRPAAGRTNGAPTRTLEKGLLLFSLFDAGCPEWSFRRLRERATCLRARQV